MSKLLGHRIFFFPVGLFVFPVVICFGPIAIPLDAVPCPLRLLLLLLGFFPPVGSSFNRLFGLGLRNQVIVDIVNQRPRPVLFLPPPLNMALISAFVGTQFRWYEVGNQLRWTVDGYVLDP